MKRTRKNPAQKSTKAAAKGERTTTGPTIPSPFTDDARLPKPGSVIEREYKGKTLRLRVLENGFDFDGKQFRSLSAAAQHATGAKAINGFLFWNLIPARTPASKKPAQPKPKKPVFRKGQKVEGEKPASTAAAAPKETR